MKSLVLRRWCYAPFGVFGTLDISGTTVYTVERPWIDNRRFTSCIPEGVYSCGPRRYMKGGYEAIEVRQVPRRSEILIHKANWPAQLSGCIAPNAWLAPGNDACPMRGVNSREAFELLMEWAAGDSWQLEIKGPERAVAPITANGEVTA